MLCPEGTLWLVYSTHAVCQPPPYWALYPPTSAQSSKGVSWIFTIPQKNWIFTCEFYHKCSCFWVHEIMWLLLTQLCSEVFTKHFTKNSELQENLNTNTDYTVVQLGKYNSSTELNF